MSGDLFSAARKPAPAAPSRAAEGVGPTADHRCAVCGAWCGFGIGVSPRRGVAGRWACLPHRAEVEAIVG